MLKLLRNIYMYIYVQQNKAWNSHDSFCANGTVIMMLFFVGLGLRSFFAESLPRILKYSPFPIWVVTVIVFLVMAVLFCLMYLDMVRSGRYMDMVSDARFHGRKATFKAICIIMSSWVFYSIMIFDVYPWAYDMYPDNCMTVECRSENVNRRYSEFVARDLLDVVNGLFGFDRNELNLDACTHSRLADFSLKPEDTIFMEFRYDKTVQKWSSERLQSVPYGDIAVWDTLYQSQKGRRGSIPPRVAVRLIIRNDSVIGLDAKLLRFGPNPEYILDR